ncbi:hypothetical protein COX95_00920 [bacterium CG_4_10_14_0_2_um_filter_33_32]|nr:MAG: hypothetical protein COS74_01720 [bacterium CG06_land_8_20_14_3_00_33_50]PIY84979.1 MAG: hypothetical protein COY76_04530 [bacterium CG_4_10_14_0_8_um_filter_33_57]PIZ86539.1 MAG: hypothetical protein COX95_00920 [bacterium CG_4_10_14_0_2_um_filter_33_32]PJA72218.1 MAG: hypothetical protein CO152_02600 [bacterium CG_4_9_14_3_um_filter_33_26]
MTSKMNNKRVCIIGAGLSGLAIAYFLSKEGFNVSVFEKEEEVGGLLQTIETPNGQYIEKFYHHIFTNDIELLNLIEELGISYTIKWHPSSVSIYRDKSIYDFSSPVDIFKLDFMSIGSRFRYVIGSLFLLLKSRGFDNLSAKEVIEKYLGKQVWQEFWRPLFEGKFSKYAPSINANWFLSRLKSRIQSRTKGKEILGYMDGSFKLLVDRLAREIIIRGGEILTNKDINNIKNNNNQFLVDGKPFDFMISTISPKIFLDTIDFNLEENHQLRSVEYIGVISCLIRLNKKITDHYWNNIFDQETLFKGIIEHTNLLNPKIYGNSHFLYLSHYLPTDSAFFRKSDSEIKSEYLIHLNKLFPDINNHVSDLYVFKNEEAQPIIKKDYREIPNKLSVKNLFITSMSHIYPKDRGLNNAVKQAIKIRDLIIDSF